ncbi:hypothetical protein FCS83_09745 [Oenococcus sp. UCMA 17063]|nr:hypothetical protein [Oenococcus sp. UCMA 17063]
MTYINTESTDNMFIDRRIRLNAICPGDTMTGLTDDFNGASSPSGNPEEGAKMVKELFMDYWQGRPAGF